MIWNAIFYLVKTGYQWSMLPKDIPKWESVRKWASLDLFDLLLERLRGHAQIRREQNMEPSVGIIDSQRVRWGNNQSLNEVDGNKKKRHIVVDKNGFIVVMMVTIANIYGCKAAYLYNEGTKRPLFWNKGHISIRRI